MIQRHLERYYFYRVTRCGCILETVTTTGPKFFAHLQLENMWKIEFEGARRNPMERMKIFSRPSFPIGFIGFLGYSPGNHNSTALINLILAWILGGVFLSLFLALSHTHFICVCVLGLLYYFSHLYNQNGNDWRRSEQQ